ncbi:MAG: glycoside hydrolase 43 family protein [Bacillota bacterium]|nr:glycoside hydrolase 43 family protein [Bacillota bacterium]
MSKKIVTFILVFSLLLSIATSTTVLGANFTNPLIWADVPDVDVLRVGNNYYMSSTTMHMNPGVPIMKSSNLVDWKIVNYVYDTLESGDKQTLKNGQNEYGKGSWASSLRYNNGTYYVAFCSNSSGKTYIYQTKNIETGPWTRSTLNGVYHDLSLFFDNGRAFLVYGSGDISIIELTSDATAIKAGGLKKTIIPNASQVAGSSMIVKAEGSHIYKVNGQYYIFNILWPSGGGRTQICHRASAIDGKYEGKVVLNDSGIAQGGIVDTPNGEWYSMLFKDSGSVGRIPYLVPVKWSNNWPVFGVNGKVPQSMTVPGGASRSSSLFVASDEFTSSGKLPLVWQWNHNPDNNNWSLTKRSGFLRLTTGTKATNILDARNTLTQRTFGPVCSGSVAVETDSMKDGDYAGLAAFQQNYGFVGVKMTGTSKSIVMVNGSSGSAKEIAKVSVTQKRVYFKVKCDFTNKTDKAYFYYSLNGATWTAIGNTLQMSYTMPHFMGYRFALFNFATKTIGGFVDFDYFRIE